MRTVLLFFIWLILIAIHTEVAALRNQLARRTTIEAQP